jgi:acyl-coenzyme A thioesterase PaaI-like protein
MVDVVAGSRPTGPINPTVDLRIELMAVVAMSTVRVRCEVLRSGRRLFVAQSRLYADDDGQPFGRSVVTFINRQMPFPPDAPRPGARTVPPLRVRIDELLGVRIVDPTTIEIDSIPRLSNGPGGTLQGGVVALLGELVTQHALGDRAAVVTDLDIRYLNPVQTGPVQARAEVLRRSDEVEANVRIVDAGNADTLVAHIMTTARLL